MKAVEAPVNYSADESWRDFARCRETDPDLFFPEKGVPVTEPLKICARCEVRQPCLLYAMSLVSRPPGVWGGTTERQRRGLRKGDGTAAAGVVAEEAAA